MILAGQLLFAMIKQAMNHNMQNKHRQTISEKKQMRPPAIIIYSMPFICMPVNIPHHWRLGINKIGPRQKLTDSWVWG